MHGDRPSLADFQYSILSSGRPNFWLLDFDRFVNAWLEIWIMTCLLSTWPGCNRTWWVSPMGWDGSQYLPPQRRQSICLQGRSGRVYGEMEVRVHKIGNHIPVSYLMVSSQRFVDFYVVYFHARRRRGIVRLVLRLIPKMRRYRRSIVTFTR